MVSFQRSRVEFEESIQGPISASLSDPDRRGVMATAQLFVAIVSSIPLWWHIPFIHGVRLIDVTNTEVVPSSS